MLVGDYHEALVNYYGLLFCPRATGRYSASLWPSLDDTGAAYDIQRGLQAATSGEHALAIKWLMLASEDEQGAGDATFFLGVINWAAGARDLAVRDWLKDCTIYGPSVPDDTTLYTPEFVRSAQYLLRNLAHHAAPPWKYAS